MGPSAATNSTRDYIRFGQAVKSRSESYGAANTRILRNPLRKQLTRWQPFSWIRLVLMMLLGSVEAVGIISKDRFNVDTVAVALNEGGLVMLLLLIHYARRPLQRRPIYYQLDALVFWLSAFIRTAETDYLQSMLSNDYSAREYFLKREIELDPFHEEAYQALHRLQRSQASTPREEQRTHEGSTRRSPPRARSTTSV